MGVRQVHKNFQFRSALLRGNTEKAEGWIENGANPEKRFLFSRLTPMQQAEVSENKPMINMLRRKGLSITADEEREVVDIKRIERTRAQVGGVAALATPIPVANIDTYGSKRGKRNGKS